MNSLKETSAAYEHEMWEVSCCTGHCVLAAVTDVHMASHLSYVRYLSKTREVVYILAFVWQLNWSGQPQSIHSD